MPQQVRDSGNGYQELVGATGIKKLVQSFTVAQMTDNANTTGFIDLTPKLPAGALVLGWSYVTTGAFAGDTTATVQVGISGTLAAFSTTTSGSCFTAISGGSNTVVATAYQASAISPRVTITSSTDFTLLVTNAGGAMTVTVYYIDLINP